MKVPIFRPTDYFAEMAKSDDHMRKVSVWRRFVDDLNLWPLGQGASY
jgi:hypothetical protein